MLETLLVLVRSIMAEKGMYSPLHSAKEKGQQSKYVPLDVSPDDGNEPNSSRRFLSGRRKYYVAGFAVVMIVSVVTVAAVLGTKSGMFVIIYWLFILSYLFKFESCIIKLYGHLLFDQFFQRYDRQGSLIIS